jgi:hypothetical protein
MQISTEVWKYGSKKFRSTLVERKRRLGPLPVKSTTKLPQSELMHYCESSSPADYSCVYYIRKIYVFSQILVVRDSARFKYKLMGFMVCF